MAFGRTLVTVGATLMTPGRALVPKLRKLPAFRKENTEQMPTITKMAPRATAAEINITFQNWRPPLLVVATFCPASVMAPIGTTGATVVVVATVVDAAELGPAALVGVTILVSS